MLPLMVRETFARQLLRLPSGGGQSFRYTG